MSTSVKKRITVRELREHPERYPHITQAAELFKPLVARFLAAKKEAEQVFENLRGADMDEAVAYCREHPLIANAAVHDLLLDHPLQRRQLSYVSILHRLSHCMSLTSTNRGFDNKNAWRLPGFITSNRERRVEDRRHKS